MVEMDGKLTFYHTRHSGPSIHRLLRTRALAECKNAHSVTQIDDLASSVEAIVLG